MEDTAGFYKLNEINEWEFAPNFVYAPTYTLLKEDKKKIETALVTSKTLLFCKGSSSSFYFF